MTINTHSATRAHGLLPKRVIDLSRASRSDIILEIAACMIDAGHGARHVARFRGESAIYDMDELQAWSLPWRRIRPTPPGAGRSASQLP